MSVIQYLHEFNMVSVLVRIILGSVCGAVLGIERARNHQAAGMRTYMVVCLGATVVMLTGNYMYEVFNTGDPARLGAQVISGIGFLGAGSIILEGNSKVKGLTTAASLWTSACIGLAIGIGFYSGGILATIAVYLIDSKLKYLAHRISDGTIEFGIYIQMETVEAFPQIFAFIKEYGVDVGEIEMNKSHEDGTCSCIISVRLPMDDDPNRFVQILGMQPHVNAVKKINYES